jgi:hypothetical protein
MTAISESGAVYCRFCRRLLPLACRRTTSYRLRVRRGITVIECKLTFRRYRLAAALAFISLIAGIPRPARAGTDWPGPQTHVRSTDPVILDIIRQGIALSPTFRRTVEHLDESDLFVYVSRGGCGPSEAPGCLLPMVTSVPGARYVHVLIAFDQFQMNVRAAWRLIVAGHELYHAVEIAKAPWVRCTQDLVKLYGEIGRACLDTSGNCYETVGALATGRQVARELRLPSPSK